MTKILDNFTKKLNKIPEYFILNEEKDYYVIGTQITIKEHRVITGNIFQLFSENVDKELPIFFILAFNDTFSKFKEFRQRKLPILILPTSFKKATIEDIQHELDKYLIAKYKS